MVVELKVKQLFRLRLDLLISATQSRRLFYQRSQMISLRWHYAKPGPIDALTGMDEKNKFLLTGLCEGPTGTPMAQKTVSGWVLFGKAMRSSNSNANLSLHFDAELIKMVSNFWELEEFPSKRYVT
ncbi:unnamed protein product [Ceratitis capitata]|uniref:(Mediterranean fruit fly) hypothetical protein n=1 Tax=Ceratitis capitata TaxID=7213 RepID=A0A811URS5_CERCA|nr:unnamed protein product [Ceratitis capitata]